MIAPWLGIGLVFALLGLAVSVLRLYQRRCLPPPERVRKLFHVIAGGVGLTLPWLFRTVWPVALLGGVLLLGLLVLRWSGGLRRGIGSMIHGVERRSLGDVCFLLGVCLVFVLAGNGGPRFAVPILTLTLADPVAALVGLRYGRHRYCVGGADKSIEGSAAFFVVALGCAAIPSGIAYGGLPSLPGVLVSALTMTVVEALAPHGLDNLLIPIVGVMAFDGWSIGGPTWPALDLLD